ncbi:class I SAM-dependent methyltransferase [Kitasatospora sp. MBT63]|uniref:class I SAM-dependent methyltransferase n=1 Tax=Kitasatospora sp. MBT63 TaxID=1444768 RepID=UPI00068A48D1|nr:class I SAM-dependent methyltransferase [Kitasatospora sp. MBT63]
MTHTTGPAAATPDDRPWTEDRELYHVVGPDLLLCAERAHGHDEIRFRVGRDTDGGLGTLHGALSGTVVRITIDPRLGTEPAATVGEATRLAVRTLAKTFRGRHTGWSLTTPAGLAEALLPALREEGFEPDGDGRLRSALTDFTRGDRTRAATMEEVYQDPYTVPWNFVPLETDVLRRLLAGTGAGARVFDLGCGYGKNARLLTSLGYRVAGSDISASAVTRARRLLGPQADLSAADATRLPWPDASFDAALDIGCLHCMPADDRPAAVRELARILTPDGMLHSRMFRPRPAHWLAAQPFRTTGFGLDTDEAAALLGTAFDQVDVETTPHATYLTASGPVNR